MKLMPTIKYWMMIIKYYRKPKLKVTLLKVIKIRKLRNPKGIYNETSWMLGLITYLITTISRMNLWMKWVKKTLFRKHRDWN